MTTDAFARAAGIAVGLSQQPIGAEYGPSWAYSPGERTVKVPLRADSPFTDFEKALAVHEASHARITRYGRFAPFKDLPFQEYRHLLNAIEDPRVQAWAIGAWPGSAPWLEAMWRVERASQPQLSPSLFLQFVTAASIADAFGWRLPGWRLDPLVVKALTDTAGARRRYAVQELPGPALARQVEAAGGLGACFAREVEPMLHPDASDDPLDGRAEALVLISAARAHRLAELQILPAALALIDLDVGGIERSVAADPRLARALREALEGGGDLAGLVDQALGGEAARSAAEDDDDPIHLLRSLFGRSNDRPASTPADIDPAGLARAVWQRFLAEVRRALDEGRSGAAASGEAEGDGPPRPLAPLAPSRRPPDPGLRQRIEQTLQTQTEPLVRRLEQAFRRGARLKPKAGYPSGLRPDLKSAMRFEADRRGYDRLWVRQRRIHDRRQAAVLLLVDLSGSMAGAEIEAAIRGVSLLATALDRLGEGIEFSVQGFQDELVPPFKSFAQPMTRALRQGFEDMALEVAGKRPRGNNTPAHNDDGSCLRDAAAILLRHPCAERVLIVVSDGQPSGRRSTADDLRAAIAATRRQGIRLIGLGLGADTAHVADFYAPDFVARIAPEDFAQRIGEVVVGALGRG